MIQVTALEADCKQSRGNPRWFFCTASLPDQEQSKHAGNGAGKEQVPALAGRLALRATSSLQQSVAHTLLNTAPIQRESLPESERNQLTAQVVAHFKAWRGLFFFFFFPLWCHDQERSREMTASAALVNAPLHGSYFIWVGRTHASTPGIRSRVWP